MQKWQYKSVELDVRQGFFGREVTAEKFQVYLNTLGEEGWKLICIVPLSTFRGTSNSIIVTFKRPF